MFSTPKSDGQANVSWTQGAAPAIQPSICAWIIDISLPVKYMRSMSVYLFRTFIFCDFLLRMDKILSLGPVTGPNSGPKTLLARLTWDFVIEIEYGCFKALGAYLLSVISYATTQMGQNSAKYSKFTSELVPISVNIMRRNVTFSESILFIGIHTFTQNSPALCLNLLKNDVYASME